MGDPDKERGLVHIPLKKRGPAKGDPRCVAGGKKGGEAVKKKYGSEHYKAIGSKGGAKTMETYGPEFYRMEDKEHAAWLKGAEENDV
jgi:general stress protein YciG